MQNFPHRYFVTCTSTADSDISVTSPELEPMISAGPREFDGPGDKWSPETLITAAVSDCYILTFKAVAAASKFTWDSLTCEVEGVLDRVEKVTRFTEFHLKVTLTVPGGTHHETAQRLLEKSDHICLISNSLTSEIHLTTEIKES